MTACLTKNNNDSHHVIDINPQKNKTLLLSEFVDRVSFIKLETNNKGIVSDITKLQFFNNKIFILDRSQNSIFVFNKNGSFVDKFQNIGRGPGEYLQLVDFEINDWGIFLLDYPNKILHYNFNLEFIQKIDLGSLFTFSFCFYKDKFWVCNEEGSLNELFCFSTINNKGVTEDTFLKRKFLNKEFNWQGGSEFNKSDGFLYLSPQFNNQIFITKGKDIQTAYTINFGKYAFPHDQNLFATNIFSPEFNYALKQQFWIGDSLLVFDFLFGGERQFVFYEKKTKNTKYGKIENDLIPSYRFFPSGSEGNILIEIVDPITILEFFEFLTEEVYALKSLTENDNPILILYHLKT